MVQPGRMSILEEFLAGVMPRGEILSFLGLSAGMNSALLVAISFVVGFLVYNNYVVLTIIV